MMFEVVKTDVYPTRYAAYSNGGKWAVFEPVDGKYRRCLEDGPCVPIDRLGAFKDCVGSAAVIQFRNEDVLGLWCGVHVEILQYPDGKWFDGGKFVADCYESYRFNQKNDRIKRIAASTLDEAIAAAEEWIRESRYRHPLIGSPVILAASTGYTKEINGEDVVISFSNDDETHETDMSDLHRDPTCTVRWMTTRVKDIRDARHKRSQGAGQGES